MKTRKRNWFKKLTDIFFRPKYFFSKIVADGKMEDAMLRAFLWGLIGGILVLVTELIRGMPFAISALFKAIIVCPVLAVILLFIFAGLMMLVSEITMGDRDWEISIKGLASIFFVYPLTLILNTLASNCRSIWVISIATDLYILFLLYNIAVYCLHCKKVPTMFVFVVGAVALATIYMSDYRTLWFMVKNIPAALSCGPM